MELKLNALYAETVGSGLMPKPSQLVITRKREVDTFRKALSGGIEQKSLFLIHGPGGYGKSTLCQEYLNIAENEFGLPSVRIDWEQHRPAHLNLIEVMRVTAEHLCQLDLFFPVFKDGYTFWSNLDQRRQNLNYNHSEDLTLDGTQERLKNQFTIEELEWLDRPSLFLSEKFISDLHASINRNPGRRVILFDTYEHIDFFRNENEMTNKDGKKNRCHEWITRLLWELPRDVVFVLSGRENHTTILTAAFSAPPPRKGISPPIIYSFAVSRFDYSDIAKAIRGTLSTDIRRIHSRKIPQYAKTINRYSGGNPLHTMLLIHDLEQSIIIDQEWSINPTDNTAPKLALVEVVERLLRFVSRDTKALIATKIAAIVQIGEDPELEKQIIQWTLEDHQFEELTSSYSSLFGSAGVLHVEIRDAILQLLRYNYDEQQKSELAGVLIPITKELKRRIAALEAQSVQEQDRVKLDSLYAMLLNIESWIERDKAFETLLHVLLLRINLTSAQNSAASESVDQLPIADLTALEELIPHLRATNFDQVIKPYMRKEYVDLIANQSHQNLLCFLNICTDRIGDQELNSTIKLTIHILEIIIYGRGQSSSLDHDRVEANITELETAIDSEVATQELTSIALLNAWIGLGLQFGSCGRLDRQRIAIGRAISIAERISVSRTRLMAKLYCAQARVAILTNDASLAREALNAVSNLDRSDSWVLKIIELMRGEMAEYSEQLIREVSTDEQRNHSLTDDAVNSLELAVEFAPGSTKRLQKIVSVLRRSGHHGKALAAADCLIKERPKFVQAHLAKGLTLYELGKLDEAKESFEQAKLWQESDEQGLPLDLNLFTNFGHVEFMLGNLDSAKSYYETRIELGLQKIEGIRTAKFKGSDRVADRQERLLRHVRVLLAYVLLSMDGAERRNQARELLEYVWTIDPTYHQAAAGLFLLQPSRSDLLEEGIRCCKERFDSAPYNLSYPFHLAEIELLRGTLGLKAVDRLFTKAVENAGTAVIHARSSIRFLKLSMQYLGTGLEHARSVIGYLESYCENIVSMEGVKRDMQSTTQGSFAGGRALIIGIANYDKFRKLPELVLKDCEDIANILQSEEHCGYSRLNVQLLLDKEATKDEIKNGFRRLAELTSPDETVIVFFSGHGGQVKRGRDKGTYLIPVGGDPDCLRDTAIGCEELTTLLSGIDAGRLVVLLDACHAAGVGELKTIDEDTNIKGGLNEKAYNMLAQGSGRVIMASSRPDEVSVILGDMENSLFTHYLVEALKGICRNLNDGLIRVFDVFHHVSENVPTRARQQPIFKVQDFENNFPLALCAGGKKLESVKHSSHPVATSRSVDLIGPVRLEIQKRLVDRWSDLAEYLSIPEADRSSFKEGHEPRHIFVWLEQRDRLSELRGAFNWLGWDDLLEVLDKDRR